MFQAHVVGQERSGTDMLSLYGAESPDGKGPGWARFLTFFASLVEVGCFCWLCVIVEVRVHVSSPCGRSGEVRVRHAITLGAESQKGPPHSTLPDSALLLRFCSSASFVMSARRRPVLLVDRIATARKQHIKGDQKVLTSCRLFYANITCCLVVYSTTVQHVDHGRTGGDLRASGYSPSLLSAVYRHLPVKADRLEVIDALFRE